MTTKKKFFGYFIESLYKSIFATLFFIVVYQFSNVEFLRVKVEDVSFDLFNKYALDYKEEQLYAPNVFLFKVDDYYLKEEKLLDDTNNTNYGYLFPRDKIADFILKLDSFVSKQNVTPSSLFIDYNFSFSSNAYNKGLSLEDKKLIEVLKQPRDYSILLVKSSNYNFIEESKDSKIQELIKNKKIIFVSTGLVLSTDGKARRYYPIKEYLKDGVPTPYPHAMITLWQKFKHEEFSISKIKDEFTLKNDIENRIIFKKSELIDNINSTTSYVRSKSNWNGLLISSANMPFSQFDKDKYEGSIILLGSTHSNNDDMFNINSSSEDEKLTGVEILTNTLMTLFYLDGDLEKFDLYKSIIIIFILFIIVNLFIEFLFDVLDIQEKKRLEFIGLFLLLSFVMYLISFYIFTEYKQWFNWFIPVILFKTIGILDLLKKYSQKGYQRIKKRRVSEKDITSK